jgi:hypothetical protein
VSNITPLDPWRVLGRGEAVKEPWPTPYVKPKDSPVEVISARVASSMVEEARVIVEGKLIPGIDTLSKFANMAWHHTLEDIDELEIQGTQGHFAIRRRLEAQQRRSEQMALTLDQFHITIDLLTKDRDREAFKDTLESLEYAQEHITNEPEDYCKEVARLIEKVKGLINPP